MENFDMDIIPPTFGSVGFEHFVETPTVLHPDHVDVVDSFGIAEVEVETTHPDISEMDFDDLDFLHFYKMDENIPELSTATINQQNLMDNDNACLSTPTYVYHPSDTTKNMFAFDQSNKLSYTSLKYPTKIMGLNLKETSRLREENTISLDEERALKFISMLDKPNGPCDFGNFMLVMSDQLSNNNGGTGDIQFNQMGDKPHPGSNFSFSSQAISLAQLLDKDSQRSIPTEQTLRCHILPSEPSPQLQSLFTSKLKENHIKPQTTPSPKKVNAEMTNGELADYGETLIRERQILKATVEILKQRQVELLEANSRLKKEALKKGLGEVMRTLGLDKLPPG